METADRSLEFLRKAQSGDRGAFQQLVSLYSSRVERLIASRLRARSVKHVEVGDVHQETLLRSYRALGSFQWQGEESFLRWLGGIAENVILELARGGARNPVFQIEHDPPEESPSPSRAMRRDERFERLRGALKNLSSEHREVILLARIEGLTFEEIARRMDRSPQAVKQLLWRALKKLKESFGDTESLHLPRRSL
ncbi:MAG: sigma-70 family RNA polymerase sigma factor [Planctomycetes bacterium]|nr:sigma-70 family RNA polymerase sigma factor [Planctomycetota bacterium]